MNGQNGQHNSAQPILPFQVMFIVVTRYYANSESALQETSKLYFAQYSAKSILGIWQGTLRNELKYDLEFSKIGTR